MTYTRHILRTNLVSSANNNDKNDSHVKSKSLKGYTITLILAKLSPRPLRPTSKITISSNVDIITHLLMFEMV